MRALFIVLLGEAVALTGVWFVYWPAALIAAGAQLVLAGALYDFGGDQ